MIRYLANEQWGSMIIGTVSMLLMVFYQDADRLLQAALMLILMLLIAIISGTARSYLAQRGGAEFAANRLVDVLGNDRALLGRGKQAAADPKMVAEWQAQHAIVYVGICEPKILRNKVQYARELTLFRARLSEVLAWTKDNGFKFFSYNQALGVSEMMLWREGKHTPPSSSALYLNPTSATIVIIGSTPEEVFHFKPNDDLMPDWKSMYAFGQWLVEHDDKNKVVIHDEVKPIEETEKDAPLADAYDPTVRGRGALKKGVTIAPSIVDIEKDRPLRTAYVK